MKLQTRNGILIRIIIFSVALLLGMPALNSPAFAEDESGAEAAGEAAGSDQKTIRLIGHRGFSSAYPENTMPAFEGACAAGFDGIEVDVWESDSGDLLIHHDAATDRMCGVPDKIWHVTRASRADYPIPYNDETVLIPTLQEVLKLSKKTGCTVFLHVKTADGYELSSKGVQKIVRLIKRYQVKKQVLIFSEYKKMVRPFCDKGVRIGRLLCRADREKANEMAKWLRNHHGDTLLVLNTSVLSSEGHGKSLVNYCHRRSLDIGTYWTYNRDELNWLVSIGADFAMSDYNLSEQGE